jgi:hypothetical protein
LESGRRIACFEFFESAVNEAWERRDDAKGEVGFSFRFFLIVSMEKAILDDLGNEVVRDFHVLDVSLIDLTFVRLSGPKEMEKDILEIDLVAI